MPDAGSVDVCVARTRGSKIGRASGNQFGAWVKRSVYWGRRG